jgi:hypothetical protein
MTGTIGERANREEKSRKFRVESSGGCLLWMFLIFLVEKERIKQEDI